SPLADRSVRSPVAARRAAAAGVIISKRRHRSEHSTAFVDAPQAPTVAREDRQAGLSNRCRRPRHPPLRARRNGGSPGNLHERHLFIHGATAPAVCDFDLSFQDYSWVDWIQRSGPTIGNSRVRMTCASAQSSTRVRESTGSSLDILDLGFAEDAFL